MARVLTDIKGIAGHTAGMLQEHGFVSVEDISQASVAALLGVPGFGPARAQQVIESARDILAKAEPVVALAVEVPVQEEELIPQVKEKKKGGKKTGKKKTKEKKKIKKQKERKKEEKKKKGKLEGKSGKQKKNEKKKGKRK